jgi:hypothetical protein
MSEVATQDVCDNDPRYKVFPDFVVFVDIYRVQVGIFRDLRRLEAWLKERGLKRAADKATRACAMSSVDPQGVTWFTAFVPADCQTSTLAHESLHLAWFILDSVDVQATVENHEALAYLLDYLCRQIGEHEDTEEERNAARISLLDLGYKEA